MEPLTKDDLRCMTHDCECGAYFKNGEGYIKQILENQEDAMKYKLMMTPTAKDIEKALQIVERLKRQIEYSKSLKDDEFQIRNHIIVLLQKILGEKKLPSTSAEIYEDISKQPKGEKQ